MLSLKTRSHLSSLTCVVRCHLSLDESWEVTSWQETWSAGLHGAPTSVTLLPVSMLQWRNAVYCWTVWCSKCQAVLFWLSTSIWNSSTLCNTVVFLVCEHFWWFRFLPLVKTQCSRALNTAQLCLDLITDLPRFPTTAQRQPSCLKPAL